MSAVAGPYTAGLGRNNPMKGRTSSRAPSSKESFVFDV